MCPCVRRAQATGRALSGKLQEEVFVALRCVQSTVYQQMEKPSVLWKFTPCVQTRGVSLATAPFVTYINKDAAQGLDCAREPGKSYSITYWLGDLRHVTEPLWILPGFFTCLLKVNCHSA